MGSFPSPIFPGESYISWLRFVTIWVRQKYSLQISSVTLARRRPRPNHLNSYLTIKCYSFAFTFSKGPFTHIEMTIQNFMSILMAYDKGHNAANYSSTLQTITMDTSLNNVQTLPLYIELIVMILTAESTDLDTVFPKQLYIVLS